MVHPMISREPCSNRTMGDPREAISIEKLLRTNHRSCHVLGETVASDRSSTRLPRLVASSQNLHTAWATAR